jgi:hypothetical protein
MGALEDIALGTLEVDVVELKKDFGKIVKQILSDFVQIL